MTNHDNQSDQPPISAFDAMKDTAEHVLYSYEDLLAEQRAALGELGGDPTIELEPIPPYSSHPERRDRSGILTGVAIAAVGVVAIVSAGVYLRGAAQGSPEQPVAPAEAGPLPESAAPGTTGTTRPKITVSSPAQEGKDSAGEPLNQEAKQRKLDSEPTAGVVVAETSPRTAATKDTTPTPEHTTTTATTINRPTTTKPKIVTTLPPTTVVVTTLAPTTTAAPVKPPPSTVVEHGPTTQ
jgi:hypothetical protein